VEDLRTGEAFDLGSVTVDESEMVDFAKRFDRQPHHVDKDAPETIALGGLIASGMFTLSVAMQLFSSARPFGDNPMLGRGIDGVRWPKLVRPGDTLSGSLEVLEITPSYTGARRGTIRLSLTLTNSAGEIALMMEPLVIIAARQITKI
jgi:acyl dehydratase